VPAYAGYGVGRAWIADADASAAAEGRHWLALHSGDAMARMPPFEAVEIELAALRDVPQPPCLR
jgi:hypothetical protein